MGFPSPWVPLGDRRTPALQRFTGVPETVGAALCACPGHLDSRAGGLAPVRTALQPLPTLPQSTRVAAEATIPVFMVSGYDRDHFLPASSTVTSPLPPVLLEWERRFLLSRKGSKPPVSQLACLLVDRLALPSRVQVPWLLRAMWWPHGHHTHFAESGRSPCPHFLLNGS